MFRDEVRSGWLFGYVDALRVAGIRTLIIYVSARVEEPRRFTRAPSGAAVCVLPAPWIYRAVRARVPNPYAPTLEQAVGIVRGPRRAVFAALKEATPYLATPLASLARELRREGCRAILCQEYECARFDACVLLGQMMRLPVFASFQGGSWQMGRIERPLRPIAMRGCAGLIIAAGSETARVRDRYDLPSGKVARIFNPIDATVFSPMDRAEARAAIGFPAGAQVVAWHGRIDIQRKGLDILLDAWERVRGARPSRDRRLLLVGHGNDAAELRARIGSAARAAEGVPVSVSAPPDRGVVWVDRYVREPSELRRFLCAADVYALPSRHEGFPVAPIEAMACGLPVVAADAPGVTDIFEGGEASGGVVVPSGDAQAMASALGRLLDDEGERLSLGQRARRRAEEGFSLEAIGGQLRSFLAARGTDLR
jgi:starch synthase